MTKYATFTAQVEEISLAKLNIYGHLRYAERTPFSPLTTDVLSAGHFPGLPIYMYAS